MGLISLDINKKYRSNKCNIVEDFYVPCLSNSNLYQRAVGYFTSGGLMHAAKGLSEFIKGDGYMQLIASPHLHEKDIEAINEGYSINEDYSKRDTAILNNLLEELEKIEANDNMISEVSCLSSLVASGRLEIKLALPVDGNNNIKHGLYHEKIGIFKDLNDDKVAFTGSSNETIGGLIENFESIYVFRYRWPGLFGHLKPIYK